MEHADRSARGAAGTGDGGFAGLRARGQPVQRRAVLEPVEIRRALTRIAHEILERTSGARDVVLLGIPTRGVPLAHRLADRMAEVEERPIPAGSLDVTMYRDDLRLRPARALGHTEVPAAGIDGKIVVLVDDVLYSGRTVRAALDALADIGRPRAVQLAVLIDRGHREIPVRPDYVGKNLPTSHQEVVRVLLAEVDGQDAVLVGVSPGPQAGNSAQAVGGRAGSAAGKQAGNSAQAVGGRAGSAAGGQAGRAAAGQTGNAAGARSAQSGKPAPAAGADSGAESGA